MFDMVTAVESSSAIIKGEKLLVLPQIILAVVSRLVVILSHPLPVQWNSFRFRSVANCVSS